MALHVPHPRRSASGRHARIHGQKLTIERSGQPEDAWFDLTYSPLADDAGANAGVLVTVIETTSRTLAEQRSAAEIEGLNSMFDQMPGFVAMLSGPEHVIEMTNAAYLQLIGHREVKGKTIRAALPDIDGQGYYELLDSVYATGEPFVGTAMPVDFQHTVGGPVERRFVDFVYQPVTDAAGAVTGIFVQGHHR
jgi:PAS domain-containing protein